MEFSQLHVIYTAFVATIKLNKMVVVPFPIFGDGGEGHLSLRISLEQLKLELEELAACQIDIWFMTSAFVKSFIFLPDLTQVFCPDSFFPLVPRSFSPQFPSDEWTVLTVKAAIELSSSWPWFLANWVLFYGAFLDVTCDESIS